MLKWIPILVLVAGGSPASAQESYTVEDMAKVRDFEIARFFPESVRESQGERLFDVTIRYADPDDIPPQGIASRRVSYRARCDNKELSISVIVLRNIKGQTVKMVTVPPGAEEFVRPAQGSREDDWLYQVCG